MTQRNETSGVVYVCVTPGCSERLRGYTEEPGLWCSICMCDLTPVYSHEGAIDEVVTLANAAPRKSGLLAAIGRVADRPVDLANMSSVVALPGELKP